MINLFDKKYSLADCVDYIINIKHPLYQPISAEQLADLTKVDPFFNINTTSDLKTAENFDHLIA